MCMRLACGLHAQTINTDSLGQYVNVIPTPWKSGNACKLYATIGTNHMVNGYGVVWILRDSTGIDGIDIGADVIDADTTQARSFIVKSIFTAISDSLNLTIK